MRTTLDLNDALLTRAKVTAARQGTTLTRLIEQGLAHVLEQEQQAAPGDSAPLGFRTFPFGGGGGMRPGIDPASNASIYAASEEADDHAKAGLPPAPRDDGGGAAGAPRGRGDP